MRIARVWGGEGTGKQAKLYGRFLAGVRVVGDWTKQPRSWKPGGEENRGRKVGRGRPSEGEKNPNPTSRRTYRGGLCGRRNRTQKSQQSKGSSVSVGVWNGGSQKGGIRD